MQIKQNNLSAAAAKKKESKKLIKGESRLPDNLSYISLKKNIAG